MNIHRNSGSTAWAGATWVWDMSVANPVALKTSQWDDSSGTILLFETWRNGGWQNPASTPGGAADPANGGPMAGSINPPDAISAVWQEKHVGKANLLFCDGHGDAMFMDSTISTPNVSYGTAPKMNDYTSVRGMWTRAFGD